MKIAFLKGLRTFLVVLAGTLVTLAGMDVFADRHAAASTLVLGLVVAFLAGLTSFVQNAATNIRADTPAGKALATFFQTVAPGLAALVITDATTDAIADLAVAIGRLAIAAALSALATLLVTQTEQSAGVALPRSDISTAEEG